ncbi:MAG: bifunctional demethylmenaquinone methyltransferase/2-methoxy-6-polyprenyl-1,4-benzoquinol methylase UbiE [Thermoguttaceae bacterium]|nr:bifunctional demethylmenaquinone methyltransferase/2-methoxy-6-polyprenyl-1,4-benzoquinol methylase UbiE [Thermoguttaceae bacterium]
MQPENNYSDSTNPAQLDRTPTRISRMFDEIAPRYDLLNHLLSLGIDRSWRKKTAQEVLARLGIPAASVDAPFLDVATGTGDLIIELQDRLRRAKAVYSSAWPSVHDDVPSSVRLVGVDFSRDMLERGRRKIARRGFQDSIHLMEGDGLNLPFAADSFAAVTIAFGLRNMVDTDRGIAELVRVCRPGGTVAILEFTMPSVPFFSGLYRFYFSKCLPRIGQWISGQKNRAYSYLQQSVVVFDSKVDVQKRLKNAGLCDVTVRRLTFGTVALYCGRKGK